MPDEIITKGNEKNNENNKYEQHWKELLERNRLMHAPKSGYDDLRKAIRKAEKVLK